MRKLGFAVTALILSSAASASLSTYTFTGTVTRGRDAVGSAITGSMTLDPAGLGFPVLQSTDGSTYSDVWNNSFLPDNPLQLSGTICSVTTCINILDIPGGYVQSDVSIRKNFAGSLNEYSLSLINFDPGNNLIPILSIFTTDDNGAASNMFSTPGLALDQPVNWFADGAVTGGSFSREPGGPGDPGFYDGFQITSMRVAAPEPSTFALMGAALIGVALALRRRMRQV